MDFSSTKSCPGSWSIHGDSVNLKIRENWGSFDIFDGTYFLS